MNDEFGPRMGVGEMSLLNFIAERDNKSTPTLSSAGTSPQTGGRAFHSTIISEAVYDGYLLTRSIRYPLYGN